MAYRRQKKMKLNHKGPSASQKFAQAAKTFRHSHRRTQKILFEAERQVSWKSFFRSFDGLVGLGRGNDLAGVKLVDLVDQLISDQILGVDLLFNHAPLE